MMTELERKIRDGQKATGSSPIGGKVRRKRTVYSRAHLDLLLKTFETNPYPGISLREKLSHITGIHESRIQVWFQNRRARMNKKFHQEEENLLQADNCLQFNPVASPVNQSAWSEKEYFRMGFQEKHEHMYEDCPVPVLPLSQSHMNSFAGPQHRNSSFPCQATNTTSSDQQRPTDSTAQQYYPYVHAVSSSHLSHGNVTEQKNHSEYTLSLVKPQEPVYGASQESSLQDILEEFQPWWTEDANNLSDIPDDLLCLF